ncbi:gamma-tubulin complex, DGRIP91/SPC98 component protein [Mycena galericulata]|nr:gamma-tubulin complex, DGRIP91/SPC98 component protein [Mycena galericulata]
MDTLKLHTPTVPIPTPLQLGLPTELASLTFDAQPQSFPKLNDSIWADALKGGFARSEILSWDALRPDYPGRPRPMHSSLSRTIQSSQPPDITSVQPRLNDPGTEFKYVAQRELLAALKLTIVADKVSRGILLVDDKDEVLYLPLSHHWGHCCGGWEICFSSLRTRFAKEGPTIHAFTHALSTVIRSFVKHWHDVPRRRMSLYLRYGLNMSNMKRFWLRSQHYVAGYAKPLQLLYTKTMQSKHTPPRNYISLDPHPVNLLSLLYDHMHSHVECQAPQKVTAHHRLHPDRHLARVFPTAVALGGVRRRFRRSGDRRAWSVSTTISMRWMYRTTTSRSGTSSTASATHSRPSSPRASSTCSLARRKSLVLLRAAEPDHPLLRAPAVRCTIEWFWTWSEIEAAWNGEDLTPVPKQRLSPPRDPSPHKGEAGLAQFRVFDLEPGSHFGHSILDDKHTPTPISALQAFIDVFPASLPPITPTLAHLTSLVFEPLLQHASKLSRTLLALFLSPSAPLQFKPHMELMHAYPLLASPAFKSRLAAALFSDAQGYDPDEAVPTSLARGAAENHGYGEAGPGVARRAVGSAPRARDVAARRGGPELLPADGDRRLVEVPVDRLAEGDGDAPSSRDVFWVEAERRLGFAIRDLPTGPGHDQWLNPLSIEALDFLYMDYKAPHPLDILITPEILSKYQRMFTHLLRIMRVEHALASVFRMCRTASWPLFPTLTPSNKLLLHLRFIAQSFVSTLSAYVFDTAIGGNVNPFLARLTPPAAGHVPAFPDVFALARAHAALLDDVLTACLLRSAQRGAGDLLRQALELVLELAVLVGELKTGRLQEYQAAPLLADLALRFRAKMAALTKALKALVDKGPLPVDAELVGHGSKGTGGIQAIAHLSESLSDWWSSGNLHNGTGAPDAAQNVAVTTRFSAEDTDHHPGRPLRLALTLLHLLFPDDAFCRLANCAQPRPAIRVRQRLPRRHLVHVRARRCRFPSPFHRTGIPQPPTPAPPPGSISPVPETPSD